jgi:hypothetical protein
MENHRRSSARASLGLPIVRLLVLLSCLSGAQCRFRASTLRSRNLSSSPWGLTVRRITTPSSLLRTAECLRGGAIDESDGEDDYDEEDDEQYDEETDGEQSEDEEEDEDEAEEKDAEEQDEDDEEGEIATQAKVEKYDDPLFPSALMGLYSTMGIMMLSRRVDLFHPMVVKIAR